MPEKFVIPIHGGDHCPGGPDPIPCLSAQSVYFDDWTANGTGASIPDDTWTNVVTGVDGANDRWFNEWNTPAGSSFGRDFATGTITNSVLALYAVWGYVVLDVPDGTTIGAGLNFVGAEVQANTGTAEDGVTRIAVYAERVPIPVGGVALRCYQKSGGAADLLEARLHATLISPYSNYEQQFAT